MNVNGNGNGKANGKIKKMMLILSKATIDNVYACFVLANGARMEGIESEIFFTFFVWHDTLFDCLETDACRC